MENLINLVCQLFLNGVELLFFAVLSITDYSKLEAVSVALPCSSGTVCLKLLHLLEHISKIINTVCFLRSDTFDIMFQPYNLYLHEL